MDAEWTWCNVCHMNGENNVLRSPCLVYLLEHCLRCDSDMGISPGNGQHSWEVFCILWSYHCHYGWLEYWRLNIPVSSHSPQDLFKDALLLLQTLVYSMWQEENLERIQQGVPCNFVLPNYSVVWWYSCMDNMCAWNQRSDFWVWFSGLLLHAS